LINDVTVALVALEAERLKFVQDEPELLEYWIK